MMEKQGVEPEIIRRIKELAHAIGFTETLFVSKAGDNSDGSSQAHAYTALKTALDWIEDNQATGEVHLIVLGDGSWDMDTTLAPTYTKNIAIYGIDSRNQAVISNSHATATHVLKFTGWCSINNVQIDCSVNETGIEINSTSANGSRLRKLHFDCASLTSAKDAILLDNSVSLVGIFDIHIEGEATNTTGIHLNGASDCRITNITIETVLLGIHLDHADDDINHFKFIEIDSATTGIQIDNAGSTDNHFEDLHFHDITTRISDSGTNTHFDRITMDNEEIKIMPETASAGTTITSKNIADTYADNYSQIDDGSGFTKPFKIVGAFLGNSSDNSATHIVKIATGGASSEVDIARLTAMTTVMVQGSPIPIESGVLPAGTRISANLQTENAVANTIQLWLLYIDY